MATRSTSSGNRDEDGGKVLLDPASQPAPNPLVDGDNGAAGWEGTDYSLAPYLPAYSGASPGHPVLRDMRRWEEVRADKDSWKGRSNRESVKGADLITHTYAPTADGVRLACVDDAVKQRAQARSEHFRQRGHNNTLCGYNPIFG